VSKDSGYRAIDVLGHEQEGLDALFCLHCVFDSLSNVQATIGRFQQNSVKWTPDWKWAKNFPQIIAIHDLSTRPNVTLSMPLSVLMLCTGPITPTFAAPHGQEMVHCRPASTLRHVRSWRKLPCELLTRGRVLIVAV